MRTWGLLRTLVVGLVLGAAIAGGVTNPAGAQSTGPSVSVTPATGFADGQLVLLSGTGFPANITVVLGQCPPGVVDDPFACDISTFAGATTDDAGAFRTEVRVFRFLMSGAIDCAAADCTTGASDLVHDQRVTVAGSGFTPGTGASIRLCGPGAVVLTDCPSTASVFPRTDEGGSFETTVSVRRFVTGIGGDPVDWIDCATETCTIGVHDDPLSWASPPLEFVDPELTVDISPLGTLRAGTNLVVAEATVSCDVPTPVAVRATVSQPGIEGTYVLNFHRCRPESPLRVFVPTRQFTVDDADFTLGDATLSVSASATRGHIPDNPPTVFTQTAGPIQLHDFDELATAIQTLIADPANVELRAQVLNAIQIRLRQDPVFRAEWQAAIGPALTPGT